MNTREVLFALGVLFFWALLIERCEHVITVRWEEHQEELNQGVKR